MPFAPLYPIMIGSIGFFLSQKFSWTHVETFPWDADGSKISAEGNVGFWYVPTSLHWHVKQCVMCWQPTATTGPNQQQAWDKLLLSRIFLSEYLLAYVCIQFSNSFLRFFSGISTYLSPPAGLRWWRWNEEHHTAKAPTSWCCSACSVQYACIQQCRLQAVHGGTPTEWRRIMV